MRNLALNFIILLLFNSNFVFAKKWIDHEEILKNKLQESISKKVFEKIKQIEHIYGVGHQELNELRKKLGDFLQKHPEENISEALATRLGINNEITDYQTLKNKVDNVLAPIDSQVKTMVNEIISDIKVDYDEQKTFERINKKFNNLIFNIEHDFKYLNQINLNHLDLETLRLYPEEEKEFKNFLHELKIKIVKALAIESFLEHKFEKVYNRQKTFSNYTMRTIFSAVSFSLVNELMYSTILSSTLASHPYPNGLYNISLLIMMAVGAGVPIIDAVERGSFREDFRNAKIKDKLLAKIFPNKLTKKIGQSGAPLDSVDQERTDLISECELLLGR